jgi:hypothetical protein
MAFYVKGEEKIGLGEKMPEKVSDMVSKLAEISGR